MIYIPLSYGILVTEKYRWFSHILKVIGDTILTQREISEQLWMQSITQNGKQPEESTLRRYLKEMMEKKMIRRYPDKKRCRSEKVYYGKV